MSLIKKYFSTAGIPIDDLQVKQLEIYMNGILEYNESINLTAITDRDEFVLKHYIDSLMGTSYDEFRFAESVADVGTGAGFPGVPLAVLNPDKKFVLIDSLNKRLKIVDELCSRAGINNVVTVHSRAEDAGRNAELRETFDVVVSRAVANMSVLVELCLPLVKIGGYLMAYKGPGTFDELDDAQRAIELLGGGNAEIRKVKVDDMEHNIVLLKKVASTPSVYPRKAGTPSKKPIR